MLTLYEAIVRFEAVSKANRSRAESYSRGEDYELMKAKECETCADECEQMVAWLGELETLRAARPQGKWIEENGLIACSNCHTIWLYRRTKFCPNCGADMRGGEDK